MTAEWQMWAGERDGQPWDVHWHPRTVQAYGHQHPRPVVTVEDPDGPWWGWLRTGEGFPTMVYPHESLFRICFPYGPEAGEKAGHGGILRLRVEFTTHGEDDAS